jgi:hypothetical protein
MVFLLASLLVGVLRIGRSVRAQGKRRPETALKYEFLDTRAKTYVDSLRSDRTLLSGS